MKRLMDLVKKLIADAKAAGKEVADADLTAALVLSPEDVTAYLDTEAGTKILQPRLDAFFTKGLKTWQEKSFPDMLETEIKRRFPAETPEQKEIRELKVKQAETDRRAIKAELKTKALSVLTTKGLPVELADHFIGDDEKATLDALAQLETVWTSKVQAAVDLKMKGIGRTPDNQGEPPAGGKVALGDAINTHYGKK